MSRSVVKIGRLGLSTSKRCLTVGVKVFSHPSFTETSPHVRFPELEEVPSKNTLNASNLLVVKSKSPKVKVPKEKLVFGRTFTDHMLEVDWDSSHGWHPPVIKPYANISISPAASCLHYGLECFEGMKAYRDNAGNVRLFRPALNMQRLNHSLRRMYMPAVDGPKFLSLLRDLLLLDREWIPEGDGYSLYIRPTAISTHPFLGVGVPEMVKLYAICSPVGPYYATGFKPISLWADTKYVRAWPGGTGDAKVGANYAIAMMPQVLAARHGCSQVLWLQGSDHLVTEVGSMNLFVVMKDSKTGRTQLITAPLSRGDILPGVTRASIMELAKDWSDMDVIERDVSLQEVATASSEGLLLEAFGAGTAAVVSPVNCIKYAGKNGDIKEIILPTGTDAGPFAKRIWSAITDIQYGRVSHDWSVIL